MKDRIKEKSERLIKILKISEEESPRYLNGLLIPREFLHEFYSIISSLMESAKFEKKYYEYIQESALESQKNVDEFVISLCEGIKEGKINFK